MSAKVELQRRRLLYSYFVFYKMAAVGDILNLVDFEG